MSYDPEIQAMIDRLEEYNTDRFDNTLNPYGFGGTGYLTNLPQAFNDMAGVANAVGEKADQALAAAGTAITATSSTNVAIGSGTRSFNASAGKAFVAGMSVKIAYTLDATAKYMIGTITSYDGGTGAMVVEVPPGSYAGSGSYGTWAISVVALMSRIEGQAVGDLDMNDYTLLQATIKDYAETRAAPTISTNTLSLDLKTANIFEVALTANITTVTISNPAASGKACSFTLIFTADGTARSVSWPAAVKWPGGAAPTITSTNGKKDRIVFETTDGGTTWRAMIAGQNF